MLSSAIFPALSIFFQHAKQYKKVFSKHWHLLNAAFLYTFSGSIGEVHIFFSTEQDFLCVPTWLKRAFHEDKYAVIW